MRPGGGELRLTTTAGATVPDLERLQKAVVLPTEGLDHSTVTSSVLAWNMFSLHGRACHRLIARLEAAGPTIRRADGRPAR